MYKGYKGEANSDSNFEYLEKAYEINPYDTRSYVDFLTHYAIHHDQVNYEKFCHKFFNAKYGAKLRELITQNKSLDNVVHFGHQQLFEGATTYTCILMLSKLGKKTFTLSQVNDVEGWMNNRIGDTITVDAPESSKKVWLFSALTSPTFRKLKANKTTLEHVTTRIFQGLKTSADKIYIVDPTFRGSRFKR